MCRHTANTIVACPFEGEPFAIHQCYICGLLLPDREISDGELPRSALNEIALAFAIRHALRQTKRCIEGLMALRQTDKAAYQAEVRRVLGMAPKDADATAVEAVGA